MTEHIILYTGNCKITQEFVNKMWKVKQGLRKPKCKITYNNTKKVPIFLCEKLENLDSWGSIMQFC